MKIQIYLISVRIFNYCKQHIFIMLRTHFYILKELIVILLFTWFSLLSTYSTKFVCKSTRRHLHLHCHKMLEKNLDYYMCRVCKLTGNTYIQKLASSEFFKNMFHLYEIIPLSLSIVSSFFLSALFCCLLRPMRQISPYLAQCYL